jgi:peptide/nickel transport system substrate-binding protein
MTRSFLTSLAGVGLLFVLVIITVINTWQADRIERTNLDLVDRVDQMEKKLESGAFTSSNSSARRSGGIFGAPEPAYFTQAMQDPSNILKRDPVDWLPADAKSGGTLYLHQGSDPYGFNYLTTSSNPVTEIQHYVSPPLIVRHKRSPTQWRPSVAYSMTSPDDGLTYIFKIREDLKWHEPMVDFEGGGFDWLKEEKMVTAHDVEFMMDMLMNPNVTGAAPLRSYFGDLVSYEAVDDYTFKIVFSRKIYAQRAVAIPSMYPVPEHLYAYDEEGTRYDDEILGQKFQDHWYNPLGMGYGPYKLMKLEPGVAVTLERNPDWPIEGAAFDKMVYLILKDQNQPPRKLRTGELSMAYLQPGQYRTEVLEGGPESPFNDGTLTPGEYWEQTYFYVGWNMRKPMFQDKKVRQALSHAFNAELLLHDVFMDLGERCTGPMPSFLEFYDKTVEPYAFDLERARALLEEAGWTDTNDDGIRDRDIDGQQTEFEFSLVVYGNSDEYRTLGNVFKEDLAKIGVKMTVQPLEFSSLLKEVHDREFDAVTLAWVSSPDVDFNQIWHSKQADEPRSSNHVYFKNAEADAIIEEMNTAFDLQERKTLAHRFHKLVAEEAPYTFFYTRKRPAYWQKDLKNVSYLGYRPYRSHWGWYWGQP